MLILGIDTSTAATSVGLVADAGALASAEHVDARHHAEVLPRLVRAVLDESGVGVDDLDMIGCGAGPGPFTGLRVGITFARAMAQALQIPVVGVCSLDALATEVADGTEMTALVRVRRAEFAWASYDTEGRRTAGPLVSRDVELAPRGTTVGDDARFDIERRPSGAGVAALVHSRLTAGEAIPTDREWPEDPAEGDGAQTADALTQLSSAGQVLLPALPLYLRRPDAVPTAER